MVHKEILNLTIHKEDLTLIIFSEYFMIIKMKMKRALMVVMTLLTKHKTCSMMMTTAIRKGFCCACVKVDDTKRETYLDLCHEIHQCSGKYLQTKTPKGQSSHDIKVSILLSFHHLLTLNSFEITRYT